MAPNIGALSLHKRPVFMLWFSMLVFLVWQTILVNTINDRKSRIKTSDLRVKALGSHRNTIVLQKDVKKTSTRTPVQGTAVSLESNSNAMTISRSLEDNTLSGLIMYPRVYVTTPINAILQPKIDRLRNTTYISGEITSSKNNIHVINKVDSKEASRVVIFPKNVSVLKIIDDNSAIPCKNIRFQRESVQKEKMQWVESVNSTLVYSAYYEVDRPNFVKVIAICFRDRVLPYYCQVWYKETESGALTMVITNATLALMDKPNRQYIGCFINCVLPYTTKPFAVSVLTHKKCLYAQNLVEVKQIVSKMYIRNFTLCHSALHHNYNKAEQLVEWIELNRILGANHFVVYNFSSGGTVQKVLEYYTRQGILEVLQWPLPSMLIEERFKRSQVIHYFEQTSAYNDCLLRNKADSRYIVVTDVDEFIVPHIEGVKTWIEMLKHLPEADSYQFKNCFFSLQKGISDKIYPEKELAEKYKISSLFVLKRHNIIWDNLRTKYIARTATSDCLKTHDLVGGTNHLVNSSVGLLHHYRNFRRIRKNVVTDETVLTKYGHEIVTNVDKVWKEINTN